MHRYYGYRCRNDLLKESINYFWLLSNSIDRLNAETDLRQLQSIAAATSQEGYTAAFEKLERQYGTAYEFDEVAVAMEEQLDRVGLNELRNLGGMFT